MAHMTTPPDSLVTDDYIGTLHWVTAKDRFDSIINLYNYYGYAFNKMPPSSTDAEVRVRFFNEEGLEEQPYRHELKTGGTLHLSVSSHLPGFRGAVSVQMIPKGRMKRLTHKEGKKQRPIATSYFVLYRNQGGFQDFSHELFAVRSDPESRNVEWATVVYPLEDTRPGVVVMNNRPLCKGPAFSSRIELELRNHRSQIVAGPFQATLPPGGSRFYMMDELFPSLHQTRGGSLMAVVRGNNIEQPMSFHAHKTGDFNIHHF